MWGRDSVFKNLLCSYQSVMGRGKYQYMQPSTLPDDCDVTHHDIWLGLKEVTSAHGIPHVTRARGESALVKTGAEVT